MSVWLKNYVITVLSASVICTVADCLLPEGGARKYARFALALILSTVMISPLLTGGFSLPTFTPEACEWDGTEAVTEIVRQMPGFENARVSVEQSGNTIRAISIRVPAGKLAEQGQRAAATSLLKNLLTAMFPAEEENISITEE